MTNQASIDLWITALTDGSHQQGTERLTTISEGERYDCCLGVLAHICPLTDETGTVKVNGQPEITAVVYDGNVTLLAPASVFEWLGLGEYHNDHHISADIQWLDHSGIVVTSISSPPDYGSDDWWGGELAFVNDDGFTHAQIADVIRFFGVKA